MPIFIPSLLITPNSKHLEVNGTGRDELNHGISTFNDWITINYFNSIIQERRVEKKKEKKKKKEATVPFGLSQD